MILRCPWCGRRAREGDARSCQECGGRFDPFETDGTCPECLFEHRAIPCPACDIPSPSSEWRWTPACPACGWSPPDEHRWPCAGCGEPLELDRLERCPSCGRTGDVPCAECGRVYPSGVWEGREDLAYWQAVAGRPGWTCPDSGGAVPEACMTWTALRAAWLLERAGPSDLLARPLLHPEAFTRDPADALLVMSRHARLRSRPSIKPEEHTAATLSCAVTEAWFESEIGPPTETVDSDRLIELAAVCLGFGCLLETSGKGELGARIAEEQLLLSLGLILALQRRGADAAAGSIRPGRVRQLERVLRFLAAQEDGLLRALRSEPGRLIEQVRWI